MILFLTGGLQGCYILCLGGFVYGLSLLGCFFSVSFVEFTVQDSNVSGIECNNCKYMDGSLKYMDFWLESNH